LKGGHVLISKMRIGISASSGGQRALLLQYADTTGSNAADFVCSKLICLGVNGESAIFFRALKVGTRGVESGDGCRNYLWKIAPVPLQLLADISGRWPSMANHGPALFLLHGSWERTMPFP
jgi:hypothetical protein